MKCVEMDHVLTKYRVIGTHEITMEKKYRVIKVFELS